MQTGDGPAREGPLRQMKFYHLEYAEEKWSLAIVLCIGQELSLKPDG